MKKKLAVIVAAAMAVQLAACSPGGGSGAGGGGDLAASGAAEASAENEAGEGYSSLYQPGTYEGKGEGRNGEITVSVTLTEDSIETVTVTEHQETPGISDPALEQIPNAIVEYQSLGVDAVSGATLTSEGIIEAAAAALSAAGADIQMLQNAPVEKAVAAAEDMETQIVVAGGGMSGIMAALTAANHGADVILVEKLGTLGGSAITSAGGLVTVDSGQVPDETDDSLTRVMERTRLMNETSVRQPDYDFLAAILAQTGETIDYIAEEFGLVPEIEDRGDYIRSQYGSGRNLITGLADQLEENGAKILLNTSAEEILMEDGQAIGLRVLGEGGEYSIYADKVIMATGGASWDEERMLAANPELEVMDLREMASVGNTGDGFRMMEEIGAKMGEGPFVKSSMVSLGVRSRLNIADAMLFDADGKRFCNESPMFTTMTNTFLLRQGSSAYYALFDTAHIGEEEQKALDEASKAGDIKTAVYGASIEELEEKLQIPAGSLRESYERYQEICESGVDADFGKDAEHLIPYDEEGGFYAVYAQPGSWGTFGGAITDQQFHVLREDGSIIENVFAVGECATSEFFGDYYQGAFSLGLYSTAGRIAAETAVNEINESRSENLEAVE